MKAQQPIPVPKRPFLRCDHGSSFTPLATRVACRAAVSWASVPMALLVAAETMLRADPHGLPSESGPGPPWESHDVDVKARSRIKVP